VRAGPPQLVVLALLGVTLAVDPVAAAEETPADASAAVWVNLASDKKSTVAANMELTETEAKDFWPVYTAYQADLQKANARMFALVKDYAAIYRGDGSATDESATKLIDEKIAIDEAETQRERAYVPRLMAVLPPRKVMRYLQIESKVRALVRYQLADRIPLVQ